MTRPDPPPSRTINALWSVFGKQQGDSGDYRVLHAFNNQLSFYEQEIKRYLPGTPPDRRDPPPLPYYTFAPGPTAMDGGEILSFSSLEPAAVRDAANRPTIQIRYFGTLFTDITGQAATLPADRALVSYSDLAQAMTLAAIPPTADEHAELPIIPSGWPALLADAARFDFEWLATGAAALLAGRVVITGAGQLPVAERLSCLDAIAALLPFGARASLSAATYAKSSGMHAIRLFFGDQSPGGMFELPWQARAGEPSDPYAREYLSVLRRGLEGARVLGGQPQEDVVRQLAQSISPLDLDQPAEVIKACFDSVAAVPAAVESVVAFPQNLNFLRRNLDRKRFAADSPEEVKIALWRGLVHDRGHPVRAAQLRALNPACTEQTLRPIAEGLHAVLHEQDGWRLAADYGQNATDGLRGALIGEVFGLIDDRDGPQLAGFAELINHLGYPPECRDLFTEESPRSLALLRNQAERGRARLREYLNFLCPANDIPSWLVPLCMLVDGKDHELAERNQRALAMPGYLPLLLDVAAQPEQRGLPGWMYDRLALGAAEHDPSLRDLVGDWLRRASMDVLPTRGLRVLFGVRQPRSATDVSALKPLLSGPGMAATLLRRQIADHLGDPARALEFLGILPELDNLITERLAAWPRLLDGWRVAPPTPRQRETLRASPLTGVSRAAELAVVGHTVSNTDDPAQISEVLAGALRNGCPPDQVVSELEPLAHRAPGKLPDSITHNQYVFDQLGGLIVRGALGPDASWYLEKHVAKHQAMVTVKRAEKNKKGRALRWIRWLCRIPTRRGAINGR